MDIDTFMERLTEKEAARHYQDRNEWRVEDVTTYYTNERPAHRIVRLITRTPHGHSGHKDILIGMLEMDNHVVVGIKAFSDAPYAPTALAMAALAVALDD